MRLCVDSTLFTSLSLDACYVLMMYSSVLKTITHKMHFENYKVQEMN